MTYKTIPFTASVKAENFAANAASQVEQIINREAGQGWEFVSCGTIDTIVAGSNGCFGLGATQSQNTSVMVLVFKK